MAGHQRLALAFLPAVAIGSWRSPLQLAVMALVADPSTLRATAEGFSETAGATLKDILVDVLGARPGEAAGIITRQNMQRRRIQVRSRGKQHRHKGLLLNSDFEYSVRC